MNPVSRYTQCIHNDGRISATRCSPYPAGGRHNDGRDLASGGRRNEGRDLASRRRLGSYTTHSEPYGRMWANKCRAKRRPSEVEGMTSRMRVPKLDGRLHARGLLPIWAISVTALSSQGHKSDYIVPFSPAHPAGRWRPTCHLNERTFVRAARGQESKQSMANKHCWHVLVPW